MISITITVIMTAFYFFKSLVTPGDLSCLASVRKRPARRREGREREREEREEEKKKKRKEKRERREEKKRKKEKPKKKEKKREREKKKRKKRKEKRKNLPACLGLYLMESSRPQKDKSCQDL